MRGFRVVGVVGCLVASFALLFPVGVRAETPAPEPVDARDPQPGTPEWTQRELDNFLRSIGRTIEQANTPGHFSEVGAEVRRLQSFFAAEDVREFRGRPRLTLTRLLPAFNAGDPWRNELRWEGGVHERLYFLNRWGAKLTAQLWGPPDLFETDGRRPAVVITTGSIQGNQRMHHWAAQMLAEDGYVVMTYDVQGQGESETFGHAEDGSILCGVTQPPDTPTFLKEDGDCPGVPFQQSANFGGGAIDAHNFFLSTPDEPHEHFRDGTGTEPHNPWWRWVDPERVGAAGHSFGAAGVSFAQGRPDLLRAPIAAVVAWDRLASCSNRSAGPEGCPAADVNEPLAPALNLTNDSFAWYGPVSQPPDPEAKLGAFDHWRAHAQDVMSIAIRGGTHLEYTSIPLVLPATRHGMDLAAHYTHAWFDKHLQGDPTADERLLTRDVTFVHRDPRGVPDPEPTTLQVQELTSYLHRSGVFLNGICSRDWRFGVPCD